MGTRGLTCVVLDNEIRVAQYGQFDHYPSGQGSTCCKAIQALDIQNFKDAVSEVTAISDDDYRQLLIVHGARTDGSMSLSQSKQFDHTFPQFDRSTGAKILLHIAMGVREVRLNTDFAGDSLFCEWVYVVDLDNEVLEVYKGHVNEPHTEGRFAHLEPIPSDALQQMFYPVKLIDTISFERIKSAGDAVLYKLIQQYEPVDKEETAKSDG